MRNIVAVEKRSFVILNFILKYFIQDDEKRKIPPNSNRVYFYELLFIKIYMYYIGVWMDDWVDEENHDINISRFG